MNNGGSEFLAALFGALVAGLVSFVLQRESFAEEARIRRRAERARKAHEDDERAEMEAVLAFSILLKLNRALGCILHIKRHVDEALIASSKQRMSLMGAVQVFSTTPDRVHFTTEELAFARLLRNDDLVNNLINLPHIVDFWVDNMLFVRSKKDELESLSEDI